MYEDGTGGDVLKDYVWGTSYVDEILSTITYDASQNPTRRFHVQDLNWNVAATTNTSGVCEELVTYDPYGMPTFWTAAGGSTPDTVSNKDADFLFQGRWLEEFANESNSVRLYHFRNRAYGPKLGRFLQKDPIGVWGDGMKLGNGYAYVGNSPTGLVDPLGLGMLPRVYGPLIPPEIWEREWWRGAENTPMPWPYFPRSPQLYPPDNDHDARGGDRRGHGVRAARPRRRRLSHGTEVGHGAPL